MCPGQLDPGHGPAEVTEAALGIIDLLGTVQTGADEDAMRFKQAAEFIREQPEVALDGESHIP